MVDSPLQLGKTESFPHPPGQGQRVDALLIGGQIWAQAAELLIQQLGGVTCGHANRGYATLPILYHVFHTSDGYIVCERILTERRAPTVGVS